MILTLLILCCINAIYSQLNFIPIKPEFQYHDRRGYIIISCDGSNKTDKISMFFQYANKNYTVDRINNGTGLYIGNFTAVSKEQKRVMIMCVDSNSGRLLGVKVYSLGYPPSMLSQKVEVKLNCRDFNFRKIFCTISPDLPTLQRLLGFDDGFSADLYAKLFFSDSRDEEGLLAEKSIFNLTSHVTALTVPVHIVIGNVLGNVTYNFTFNRYDIQKPNEPIIEIQRKTMSSFEFVIDMSEFCPYHVTMICNSNFPRIVSKILSFDVNTRRSQSKLSGDWPKNSEVSCSVRAKTTIDNKPIGQFSDSSSIIFRLLEGRPNVGPYSSSRLLHYSSISDRGMLLNISIYYVNLALLDRNGLIVKYKWICGNCVFKKRNVSNIPHYLPSNSRSLRLDSAALGSDLSLYACTDAGCSNTSNTLRFERLRDHSVRRRLSVIRHIDNPENVTLIWKEHNTEQEPLYVLLCSFKVNEQDCSSIEMVSLARSNESSYFRINDTLQWKFALLSSEKHLNYNLKWESCIYNSVKSFEVSHKLRYFNHTSFVQWNMQCGYYTCEMNLVFIPPNCVQFPDMHFYRLVVKYKVDSGYEEIDRSLVSLDEVEFSLSDLRSGWKSYKAEIYIVSPSNETFHWFNHTFTTNFMCPFHVGMIILAIFIFVMISFGILCVMKTKIRKSYFKKHFQPQRPEIITTNHFKTALQLLNTNGNACYQTTSALPDSNHSPNLSHDVTPTESSEVSEHYSEDGLIHISDNSSMSYTARPMPNGQVPENTYTKIAIPSTKDINHSHGFENSAVLIV